VVGIGCHYPGATSPRGLWETILAKRRQFRRIPDCRLPLADYHDPDPTVPDKTYAYRAGVIDGFEFDWAGRRIPKATYDCTDIVHWLSLEVALHALTDAGYTRKTVPTNKTGVILGNTLTGEQSRSSTMRLRWPYVRRALRATAAANGIAPEAMEALLANLEGIYKSVFPEVTEDAVAAGLSNTIAGRICNFLNLDGGGYTVDGACSSSVIAIATAATALANGDMDMALAGGVDISLDTFELIGFAKAGALAREDMSVYDRRANGFIPGEGCGFVVLKRLEDARAAGDYVYAIVRGWGISSDGKGGITAPSSTGQSKAIRRAYERAGYSPHQLDFVEGHGTGTPLGDRTEIDGIVMAMAADGELAPRRCGVTSFKSLVGHTKAAAGVGGFIKAVLAVNQRVLPPTTGCIDPHPLFADSARCLYPMLTGEVRPADSVVRAGLSGMGFGGINSHIALESADAPSEKLTPSLPPRALLVSAQETELFVVAAASLEALLERLQAARERAFGIAVAELADLAAVLAQDVEAGAPVRAAWLARTPDELLARIDALLAIVADAPPGVGEVLSPEPELWLSNRVTACRVGFLFPGQGSQKLNAARVLVERFDWAQELVANVDRWLQEAGSAPVSPLLYRVAERAADEEELRAWKQELAQTTVAQPVLCVVSLLWARYLQELGIEPAAVGGHSLGELTAFCAAGALSERELIQLAARRSQAMAAAATGTMASLFCDGATAEGFVRDLSDYVIVANRNSPQQTAISGTVAGVEAAIARAEAAGVETRRLPVSGAFHSQLVAEAAAALRTAPLPETTAARVPLLSSATGEAVTAPTRPSEHFAAQVTAPVNFVALVESLLPQCDLLVEVGPGKVLSGLVDSIAPECPCFPVEAKAGADRSLNTFLGNYFVRGGTVRWSALYANRLVLPFVPSAERAFIENPCERPFPPELLEPRESAIALAAPHAIESAAVPAANLDAALTEYFHERSDFLADLIRADLETLPLPTAGERHD